MYNRSEVLVLVREIIEQDEESDEFLTELADRELTRMIFHSPVADAKNLRLSISGYEFLRKGFEAFEIPFMEDYYITARDLLLLNEQCTCPYYVSMKGKFFAFFEQEIATRLKLLGGNLSLIF